MGVPDFTAKIIENSRILRIKLSDFRACLEGKFDFDTKGASGGTPGSPMHNHLNVSGQGQFGFAARNSIENSSQQQHGNDLYEYPNTYHLNHTPNISQNESKSSDSHDDFGHKMKHMFSNKKSKKHKSKSSQNGKRAKYDSVNVYDSDHSSDHHHKSLTLPKRKHVGRGHSDPTASRRSVDSIFDAEPLMHSTSEPHIVSTLPGQAKISDNSKNNMPIVEPSGNHLQQHHNPNYRLSPGNNLSTIHHLHFNDNDDDIAHPNKSGHVKVQSSSDLALEEEDKDTIIEIDKIQIDEEENEMQTPTKHVYKSNEKKRRTKSSECPPLIENDGESEDHLYKKSNNNKSD